MRAVALLLVCAGPVRVGAFSALPESEQIESRSGNNDATYIVVKTGAYCENRDRGKVLGPGVHNVQACALKARADKMCGSGFSFGGGGHCDCSPVGEPCVAKDYAGPGAIYTVYGFKQKIDTPQYVKVQSSAYCLNRVKSRYATDVAACAAAVSADPACGNGFSFYGGRNDGRTKYCDCPPPGDPCVAQGFNTGAAPNIYTVYGFPVCGAGATLDLATMKCMPSAACGGTLIDDSSYVDANTNAIKPHTPCGAGQYQSAAPTLWTDRGCTAQPTCANYQKVDNPGDSMTRLTCKNKCDAFQYYSAEGTCKALAVCAPGEAEVTPATLTSNRVCSSATMLCDTAAKCKGRAFSSGTILCSHPGTGNNRAGGCYGAKFTGDVQVECSGARACELAEVSGGAQVTCSFKDACSNANFRANSKVTCSVAGACAGANGVGYPSVHKGAEITCAVPNACAFFSDGPLHDSYVRRMYGYAACCRGRGCPTQAWRSASSSPTTQPVTCCVGGGLATATGCLL